MDYDNIVNTYIDNDFIYCKSLIINRNYCYNKLGFIYKKNSRLWKIHIVNFTKEVFNKLSNHHGTQINMVRYIKLNNINF